MLIRGVLIFFLATVAFINATYERNKEVSKPYEFGFNIEGYQHRHETKNEMGIVMGEFGFITADGVYHVTAYATDENGKFKILFMKNIKIGLPGNQSTSALQLPTKPPNQLISTARLPSPSKQTSSVPNFQSPTRSCSGCAIPSVKINEQNKLSTQPARHSHLRVGTHGSKGGHFIANGNTTEKIYNRTNLPAFSKANRRPKAFLTDDQSLQQKAQNKLKLLTSKTSDQNPSSKMEKRPKFAVSKSQSSKSISAVISQQDLTKRAEPKNSKAFLKSDEGRQQHLKIGIDLAQLENMRAALSGLLYKFNYTVGYHGHHESGFKEGSKDGEYFFVARDGMQRNVQYVANDFGYQPYLTQTDAKAAEIPKEATEKQAGLKGYEFKWFSEKE